MTRRQHTTKRPLCRTYRARALPGTTAGLRSLRVRLGSRFPPPTASPRFAAAIAKINWGAGRY